MTSGHEVKRRIRGQDVDLVRFFITYFREPVKCSGCDTEMQDCPGYASRDVADLQLCSFCYSKEMKMAGYTAMAGGVFREPEPEKPCIENPAACHLQVCILVDSADPERDCSRLRNALEGMIEEDMKRGNDGWLPDEGAVFAGVTEAGAVKFDVPRKPITRGSFLHRVEKGETP